MGYNEFVSGRPGFDSLQGQDFSVLHYVDIGFLSKGYRAIFPPREKRPGREAHHSTPSSAEDKNGGSFTSTPQYVIIV
jgi:hypothetical protein